MTVIVESINALRKKCDEARARGGRVGLVPTMGYLHEGHLSLMREAAETTDLVVASVFVNPLQFGAGEDLDRYPHDPDGDLAACGDVGVDLLFRPTAEVMYPRGAPMTTVSVAGLTDDLCGRARPTHFDGVATVVTKLFAITGPCSAFFGRKDYQQLVVVGRLVQELNLPVTVVGCPIVREDDGLAMSSRNAYLSCDQREAATVLYGSLAAAVADVADGERNPSAMRDGVWARLSLEPSVEPEYAEVRDADDLARIETIKGSVVVAVAARLGATRLIDNVRLGVDGDRVCADMGVGGPDLVGARVGALS